MYKFVCILFCVYCFIYISDLVSYPTTHTYNLYQILYVSYTYYILYTCTRILIYTEVYGERDDNCQAKIRPATMGKPYSCICLLIITYIHGTYIARIYCIILFRMFMIHVYHRYILMLIPLRLLCFHCITSLYLTTGGRNRLEPSDYILL